MKKTTLTTLALASFGISAAQAATIFTNPTSVTSDSSDFRAASNMANGTGLNAADPPTHDFGGFATSWVTNSPNADYFNGAGPITLTIDLGSDTAFTDFVTWAYGGNTGSGTSKQGNNVKDFSLRFATDADGIANFGTSVTLNPSFAQSASSIPPNGGSRSDAELYTLGETVTARYIEMTVTDNYRGEAGFIGGDRVGLGAVAVAIVPEPSSTALLGLGGLALILRRRK